MGGLIRFSLTQRLLMLLAVVVLAGLGWNAARNLPIDAFPDVSIPQVKVIVKAPGMTPEEVESRITLPVELELLGLPHQKMLRSIAKYALTDITIDFEEGTDVYWARQQVAERLNNVWGALPAGVTGGIAPLTTPLGEMFMFTIEGETLNLMEKRRLLDWVLRPALRTVSGVADVNALGGYVRSFEVHPRADKLAAVGVTLDQVAAALTSNNRNFGSGRLEVGEEALLVRSRGRIQTLSDVRRIVVAERDGVPVTVGDVCQVRIGALTRYGALSENGTGEAVEGLVLGLRGANARQVVEGVRAKLDQIAPTLPPGIQIKELYDRGKLVDRAVHTVVKALTEAIVLVLVLLILFLGDLRAAVTVALILPLAALFTFFLMRRFGLSANLMSLGGLAIAIGMLVDAAVVVVENIATYLSHEDKTSRLPDLHIIYRAVREVAAPVTSGILIIVIVFLPLLTLQGLEGKLFIPVALTIVFALAGSLILSLTVIPVLASYILKQLPHREPWLPRVLHRLYEPVLHWSLAHGRVVLIGAGIGLVVAAGLYTQIGKTFMPEMDEGDIVIQTEKLPSINLEQTVRLDQAIQKALLEEVPEVKRVVSRVGADEIGLDPMGLNETDHFLVLKPREAWEAPDKPALIDKLREVMRQFPGIVFGFTQPIQMRVTEMLTGVRGDVAVKLFGSDLETLNRKAEELVQVIQQVPGAVDVMTRRNEGVQYLDIVIDRLAAGRMGLDGDTLGRLLRSQIEGLRMGIVQEGVQRTPLLLRGPGDPDQVRNLQVTLPDGRVIPLSAVARLEKREGVVSVRRERGQRYAVIRANVRGRDLVGFVAEARRKVAEKVQLPTGYFLEWGGQFENQQRAARRLALVIPAAIGLIFLLLFSTFGSVRQALLVLGNIPLALIGGVVGLWLSGEYLSVPASVGFIALLGIAVLNGVMLVTYFNQLRALGRPIERVVVEGAMRRLRPVLMTASIAAFGLVPLLFATGPGSEIQRPLAIVVIGGLVTSTALTLIVLPILYRRFGGAS
ncbi:efflux RND transporter permease subunit [Methylohalobius crimeensis]|uniref:efflux RND transporter permease subunit n=1 Tax=Methylohalobius crimeensis TaxID=244365 RepID=UPI0003B748A3|nr:CusA/CzcA family heavy metal efflux RND transporter [Methylohalobius crimeensis]